MDSGLALGHKTLLPPGEQPCCESGGFENAWTHPKAEHTTSTVVSNACSGAAVTVTLIFSHTRRRSRRKLGSDLVRFEFSSFSHGAMRQQKSARRMETRP